MRTLKHVVHAITGNLGEVRASRALLRHWQRFAEEQQAWWQHENVVGLCVAQKTSHANRGPICVQVLVRQKLASHKLRPKHRIPRELSGPALSKPILTDVHAVGRLRLEALVSVQRPAHPGFDLGNELGGSGTLGCVVRDANGESLGLSCAHVLAPDGAGDVGAAVGGGVLCPSLPNAQLLDVVSSAPIGRLVKVLAPSFGPDAGAANLDAALFRPDAPGSLSPILAQAGVQPQGVNDNVKLGDAVHKIGAASGQTQGTVQALALCIKIPYGNDLAHFVNQIGISPFTQPGDSGALVLDANNRAIGLHMGAADGMSICTPIARVLSALGCKLA